MLLVAHARPQVHYSTVFRSMLRAPGMLCLSLAVGSHWGPASAETRAADT